MALLKRVNQNKVLRYCRCLSILGAFLLLMNFVTWSAASRGFDRGFKLGESIVTANRQVRETVNWHISIGGGTYELLSQQYSLLGLLSAVLLALAFVRFADTEHRIYVYIVAIINVIVLVVICWKLSWLLGLKNPELNESLGSPFNVLARESVLFDTVSIGVGAILILVQLVSAFFIALIKNESLTRYLSI